MSNALHDLEKFFEYFKPGKNEWLEIRFIVLDNSVYKLLDDLNHYLIKNNYVFYRNKSVCFFVKDIEAFKKIILFSRELFFNTKICYGINPRKGFKENSNNSNKDFILNGSYDCVKNYKYIALDIDDCQDELKVFEFVKFLKKYGLHQPCVINSGGGFHVIYKINKQKVTEARKLWLKGFVEEISVKGGYFGLNVDVLHDATRVFSVWGTFNKKRDSFVELIRFNDYVNDFKIRSKRVVKQDINFNSVGFIEGLGSVKNSLEFTILSKPNVPKGDRHMTLVFALKMLLRDGKSDYKKYESALKPIYGSIDLNYSSGLKGKEYNKGIVINWCKDNWSWVKKHDDVKEKLLFYAGKEKLKELNKSI